MTEKPIHKEEKERKALEALIMFPTIKEASEKSGLSESTLYRYLSDEEFKSNYRSMKKEMIRGISNTIQRSAYTAIETLMDVMNNPKAMAMARVTAAKTILEMTYQSHEKEDILTELEELREAVEMIQSEKGR